MASHKKKKGKPKNVRARSNSSVISDLSNPSDSESSWEPEELAIPDRIDEGSDSEEYTSEPEIKKDKEKNKGSKNKGKSKNNDDEAQSLTSRKTRKKKKKKSSKKSSRSSYSPSHSSEEEEDLLAENEALFDEVTLLRRKLNARGDNMEMTQLQMDLKRSMNEASELKIEIDEYEEAVGEKDGLIKKLTEAVDCQLDKVEYLELKLQRAEDEFVKMEDEMADLEDQLENHQYGEGGPTNSQLSDDRIKDFEEREADLEDRETQLIMSEQELLDREKDLVDREEELEIQEENLADLKDDLRMKELQFEEREREMAEQEQLRAAGYGSSSVAANVGNMVSSNELEQKQTEINTLKRNLALKTGEVHELRGQLSSSGGREDTNRDLTSESLRQENDRLRQRIVDIQSNEREWKEDQQDELRRMQVSAHNELEELYKENETLKRKVEMLTLENEELRASAPSDIHQQLNQKDEHAKRQQQEIAQVWQENDSLKDELKEITSRLKNSEAQVAESKSSSGKKMKQKDDTIEFMQSEMVRLTKEKQDLDKELREKVREAQILELAKGDKAQDEEAELMRIQAFNEQLRILDDMNRELENKLKQAEYDHEIAMKQKESKVLEIEEELSDLNFAVQSGNGGDYAASLKYRQKDTNANQSEIEGQKEKMADQEKKLKAEILLRDEKIIQLEAELEEKKGGGFGLFGRKASDNSTPMQSPKPTANSKGLWGVLTRTSKEERSKTYDNNHETNMVALEEISERGIQQDDPVFSPILTNVSIEDELRAIEDQAKNYSEPDTPANIEDELKKIEDQPKQFERPTDPKSTKQKVGDHLLRGSSPQRINMAGRISDSSGDMSVYSEKPAEATDSDSDEKSESSKSSLDDDDLSVSGNSSVSGEDSKSDSSIPEAPRMNIASRLEELRAKRNKDSSDND